MTNRKTNRIVALFVALAALVVLCFALTGSSRSQAKAGPAYVETVAETSDWQDPDYPVTLCPKEQKPGNPQDGYVCQCGCKCAKCRLGHCVNCCLPSAYCPPVSTVAPADGK